MQNNDEDRKLEKRLEVIQGSDGSGIHRKLRLGPGLKKDNPRSVPNCFFFFNFVKLLLFYTSVCNNLVDFFGDVVQGLQLSQQPLMSLLRFV